MATNSEWLKNKDKKRFYPVSHAKSTVRNSSTVDKDLSTLEEKVGAISETLENGSIKGSGMQEMTYEEWNKLSEEQKKAISDVIVTDYPASNDNNWYTLLRDVNFLLESLSSYNGFIEVENNTGFHNSIYRGKNLGSTLTSEHKLAIKNGTFKDLYIGDYWESDKANKIKFRIAGFNYWNCDGTANNRLKNHVVIVADYNEQDKLPICEQLNDFVNGYANSSLKRKLYSESLVSKEHAISVFGNPFILAHNEYLPSKLKEGGLYESCSWITQTFSIPTAEMVFGYYSTLNGGLPNSSNRILPLFIMNPELISGKSSYWLRNTRGTNCYSIVNNSGLVFSANANEANYVRLVFGVTGN